MLNYSQIQVIVDTQWLAEHLNDSNLRILEVAVNPEVIPNQVIPGTVIWNPLEDLKRRKSGGRSWLELGWGIMPNPILTPRKRMGN